MTGSRRRFLKQVGLALAGGAGAGMFLAGCASSGLPLYRYEQTGNIIDLYLGWYPELYKTGGVVELLLTGTEQSVVVVRVAIDRFTAVSPVCPHDGCRVELRENLFRCPCGGSRYTLEGAVRTGPSDKPLVSYRTEYRESSLRIFLP
jgi:nitrite reductase/ring-hydroxylating ferredoxin subunit